MLGRCLRRQRLQLIFFQVEQAQVLADKLLVEIEVGQLAGKLLPREDVNRELYEWGTEIRNRFEIIPHRVTDRLLAADTRAAALEILQDEFANTLAFAGAAIARPLRAGRERR